MNKIHRLYLVDVLISMYKVSKRSVNNGMGLALFSKSFYQSSSLLYCSYYIYWRYY